MPEEITAIGCEADLSNHFTKSQYFLEDIFRSINGVNGVWTGMIPDGGRFPLQSGFASRVTTLGQQRLGFRDLNRWVPMDASLNTCVAACDPPVTQLDFGNAQHNWYRLLESAYNTTPYCLDQLFSNHLGLEEQIAQIYKNLKFVTMDTLDEFARNNYVGLSAYRWMGYDPNSAQQAGAPDLLQSQWRFATDANGFVDTTYIILNPTVHPESIAMLSTDILNQIRNFGIPTGTFDPEGKVTLVSDYQTFSDLPLYDTNRRQDARFRAPSNLDPSYVSTTEYAGYKLKNDYFALRYFWTTSDPLYPNGVLKRVFHWADNTMSEGCWSNTSLSYQKADFQLSIPFSDMAPVFLMQNGETPLSAGSGVNFQALASPYNGTWRWVNSVNEITPCNVDLNKGFWRMVLKKAAKPVEFGQRGNVVLHRRFPVRGITASCQPLGAPTATYASCDTCPPVDFYPPPLVDTFACGGYNSGGFCTNV